jgi:hypothetical protein
VTGGVRVLKVQVVDVAIPSGPIAATVNRYEVPGCSSSLFAHVPSGPACPLTFPPVASTSVTAANVPDEALTVTGTLGRTSTARSAGQTLRTAGCVPSVGLVVGEACCARLSQGGFR